MRISTRIIKKHILFLILIPLVFTSQAFLLKPHLKYGFDDTADQYVSQIRQIREENPNLIQFISKTLELPMLWIHEYYYMGILNYFFMPALIFYFLIVNSFFVSKVLANENQEVVIHYPAIDSNSEIYPIKRLWEKAFYYLQFSQKAKVNYHEGLLKERLAELKYVAEKNLLSQIETSSNRFAYQAGITINQLKNLNDKNKLGKILNDFNSYSKILANLRDLYTADSSYWRLIQQDIDTLNILSDQFN